MDFYYEIHCVRTMTEGTGGCPPGPPLRCAIVLYYLFRRYLMGGAQTGGKLQ
jgi:hypothetical protein